MNTRLQWLFVVMSIISTSSLVVLILSDREYIVRRNPLVREKKYAPVSPLGQPQQFYSPQNDAANAFLELSGFKSDTSDLEDTTFKGKVHFVWCSRWMFEFRHFLSVLSAWKILQPDGIVFHKATAPGVNKYNDWIGTLKKTVAGFVVKDYNSIIITGKADTCGLTAITRVLQDDGGGVYVDAEVIVTEEVNKLRRGDSKTIYIPKSRNDTDPAILIIKQIGTTRITYKTSASDTVCKQIIFPLENKKSANKDNHSSTYNETDQSITSGRNRSTVFKDDISSDITPQRKGVKATCYVVGQTLYPKDIFLLDTAFGALGRKVLFGSEHIKENKILLPGSIPKIVHYVWYGNTVMTFRMYLSMLSTLYVMKPDKVYIHGDGGLYGRLFDRVRRNSKVVVVKRDQPESVFGQKLMYLEHTSDILRADCLLKYGGIYMDWDVIWLKDPDDLIKTGRDTIASFDHLPQRKTPQQLFNGADKQTSGYHTTFPDTVNLGVLMAKPQSTFVKFWQNSLVNYKPNDFMYNSVELPYRIYEQHPESLYIDARLQVMCYQLKCHPTFHPNYKVMNESQPFDWKNDVYSIHFTYPDPDELAKEEWHNNGTGMFAQIRKALMRHDYRLD